MKKIIKLFSLILLVLFILACEEEKCPVCPEPEVFNIEGTWKGILEIGGTLTLTLAQDGSNVTGSGTMVAGTFSAACSVTAGTIANNKDISLTIESQGFQPFNYEGEATDISIHNGELNGSGFVGAKITFT